MSATWGGGNRCTEEAAVSWLIHQCKPGADMRNDAPVHTQRREERWRETEAHLSPEPASLTPNCRGGEEWAGLVGSFWKSRCPQGGCTSALNLPSLTRYRTYPASCIWPGGLRLSPHLLAPPPPSPHDYRAKASQGPPSRGVLSHLGNFSEAPPWGATLHLSPSISLCPLHQHCWNAKQLDERNTKILCKLQNEVRTLLVCIAPGT